MLDAHYHSGAPALTRSDSFFDSRPGSGYNRPVINTRCGRSPRVKFRIAWQSAVRRPHDDWFRRNF